MAYIIDSCKKEIETKGAIENIIGEYVELKPKGKDLVGTCPFCDAEKKFSVSKVKNIWGCWVCKTNGGGYVSFIMAFKKIEWLEAMQILANNLNITIEYDQAPVILKQQPAPKAPQQKAKTLLSFRDEQMRESGLVDTDQKYKKRHNKTDGSEDYIEMDRYQKGSVEANWTVDLTGDDMVMHYMDLNGNPMTYRRKDFSKDFPLIRVRYANPAVHLDRNGRPMKYQSPPGSGTHVWISQTLRNKYESSSQIDTLFIQEGEKKADKATKHGITSVGIMGIHNIAANKALPREFELIIKRCDVKNVVFVVDSDYLDISDNIDNAVDQRPKSFLRAILNFHDYFYALTNSGIILNIYFSYIKPEQKQKGIDDLLVNVLKGNEKDLLADFNKTMLEVNGLGTYINCHKITNISEYKLRADFFHLGSNEQFAKFHFDKLKERKVFKIGREKFKFAAKDEFADKPENTLVLAQPLSHEEEYWEEKIVKRNGETSTICQFKYVECCLFLTNRKFGRFKVGSEGDFNFIKIDDNVVNVVKPIQIKDYLMDFTRHALQKKNVLEMLYKGAKMYLSENLNNLDYINLNFHKSDKGLQYLYFQKTYWKITAEGFEEKPISDLNGHVWADKLIDFAATKMDPFFKFIKDDKNKYHIEYPNGEAAAKECYFFNYLMDTSNFYWRETHQGYAKLNPGHSVKRELTEMEKEDLTMHFISKCVAIGYMLHDYFNPNVAKAVIAMDGKLSEVGSSNGRSGKSLMGLAFAEIVPMVTLSGKQKDLTEDKFIYDGITERTRVVNVDDARTNLDFEFFFSNIGGAWKINPKGSKSFELPRETSPKLFITTNHALNGEGGSFRDRQFLIAFSDYFNENHRPVDEYGVLLFIEWGTEKHNRFLNTIATCIQMYLMYGLVAPPMERLEQRRLRQQIGESFIEWAESYFDPEFASAEDGKNNLNRAIDRSVITESFYTMFPESKRYIDKRKVKTCLVKYCLYKKYIFNPGKDKDGKNHGGDDKRNSVEYFTVSTNGKIVNEQPF